MYPGSPASDRNARKSQRLHLNPRSGHWNPDASARAHHIGIAVALQRLEFLPGHRRPRPTWIDYGAEMLAEIARFFVSKATYDEERGRPPASGASSGRMSSTPATPTLPTTASTTTRTPT